MHSGMVTTHRGRAEGAIEKQLRGMVGDFMCAGRTDAAAPAAPEE
jgi:hypothetical protein